MTTLSIILSLQRNTSRKSTSSILLEFENKFLSLESTTSSILFESEKKMTYKLHKQVQSTLCKVHFKYILLNS